MCSTLIIHWHPVPVANQLILLITWLCTMNIVDYKFIIATIVCQKLGDFGALEQ